MLYVFSHKFTDDIIEDVQKRFLDKLPEKRDDSKWIDDDVVTDQRSSFSTLGSILRRGLGNMGGGSRERTLSAVTKNTLHQSLKSPAKRSFGSSRRRRDRRRRYKGKSHKKSHHHSFDFESTEEGREPILDIFGKGTRSNFKRETQTDSNSIESSPNSESSDPTSSDDNQQTKTTSLERDLVSDDISIKYRKGREKLRSIDLDDSISSDDNLATKTTAKERGLFGKSKKKGGPKQHSLKRASFSRMWSRGESTDSNSTSTSESTESVDSSESSGNSSTEPESSPSSESIDFTSSDDNQPINTTTVERYLFREARRGGYWKGKHRGRYSGSESRGKYSGSESDEYSRDVESSGSTSSDDNLVNNATTVERGLFGKSKKKGGPKQHPLRRASTVERGLFGKSKKKGGPKQHPLKRAQFSRMWRRGESTDSNSTSTSESTESVDSSESSGNSSTESESSPSSESSDSTSSGDNLVNNATTVERGLFGKSKKKGGPKKHPLKRASTVDRGLFGKSKKKGGPKQHPLRRASTVERGLFGKSKKKGGPKQHPLRRASTVERGLFGKSKKKGGSKQHPLKRAPFSRIWRRGESKDSNSTSTSESTESVDSSESSGNSSTEPENSPSSESSDFTSSDDNQPTKTTALERDLFNEDIKYRKGRGKLRSKDSDEYFQGMKRYSEEGSELEHPAYRRYQKESWKRIPAENWDSPSNADSLSDSNHLSKRFENLRGFDVLKRAVHLLLQDDLNSKREESLSEEHDSEHAKAMERMSGRELKDIEELKQLERREDEWFDAEEEKFYTATGGSSDSNNVQDKRKANTFHETDAYTSTRFHQGRRRNIDPHESANSDVSTEESESDDDDDDDKRTPSTFRMYEKRSESNRKWSSFNNVKAT